MSDLMLSLPQQFFSLYITPDSGGYVYEQCWCVSHVSHATGGGGSVLVCESCYRWGLYWCVSHVSCYRWAVCWCVSHATCGSVLVCESCESCYRWGVCWYVSHVSHATGGQCVGV